MPFPITIRRTRGHRLTGRIDFRMVPDTGWFARPARLALFVQVGFDEAWMSAPRDPTEAEWKPMTLWREAHPLDLANPALQWLMKNEGHSNGGQ